MKVKHQHKTLVLALYIAAIFYSLHYALTLYLASSYLERFISIEKLGIIYVLSAIFSIYTTFSISRFLNKYSNYKVFISSILAEIVVLVLLSVANSVFLAIPLFIIGNILANTVFLSLNISVSEVSKKSDVGVVRGVYFTILNFGILCAAYFSGVFFEIGSFFLVYLMSAFLLVPVLYIGHKYLDSIEEPHYKDVSFTKSLKAIYKNKDIYDISIIQFVLSCFYAGIVVYTAPYLRDVIGIPTSTYLQVIMPIALFPFVIFPYELGVLADKKIGEKELIIIGLLIMVLSTFIITQIHSKNVLIWAAVLFLTRTGASIVESMASVYFYKKIDDSSAGEIALFSSGIGSFAYIIMPLVAFVLLSLFELPVYSIYIFICLALLFGLKYAIRLHDTL